MEDEPEIDRVSIDGRFVVMSDGAILPITNFFDDDGDECEPGEATTVIAGTDEYGWLTIELFDEAGTIH